MFCAFADLQQPAVERFSKDLDSVSSAESGLGVSDASEEGGYDSSASKPDGRLEGVSSAASILSLLIPPNLRVRKDGDEQTPEELISDLQQHRANVNRLFISGGAPPSMNSPALPTNGCDRSQAPNVVQSGSPGSALLHAAAAFSSALRVPSSSSFIPPSTSSLAPVSQNSNAPSGTTVPGLCSSGGAKSTGTFFASVPDVQVSCPLSTASFASEQTSPAPSATPVLPSELLKRRMSTPDVVHGQSVANTVSKSAPQCRSGSLNGSLIGGLRVEVVDDDRSISALAPAGGKRSSFPPKKPKEKKKHCSALRVDTSKLARSAPPSFKGSTPSVAHASSSPSGKREKYP